jgi:hypothetical protein
MNIATFIKWLETHDQELEVAVVEYREEDDWCYNGEDEVLKTFEYADGVCFDDPIRQARATKYTLTLGVEK